MDTDTGEMPFWTREAVLALALNLAGCEPVPQSPSNPHGVLDRPALLPCINRYDEDMLFVYGGGEKDPSGNVTKQSRFANMATFDAAKVAWEEGLKGDVSFGVKLTPRAAELIKAYREQTAAIETLDAKAFDVLTSIMDDVKAGAIQSDEAILRVACIILKTRKDFVMMWQMVVPLLSGRIKGRAEQFDSTATNSKGETVQAKAISRPGFRTLFLNASEKMRKAMKF